MEKTNRLPLPCLDNRKILIAPSILAADFSCLGREIQAVEAGGAEILHVDVMDGHFVPNISVGPPVVEAIRKITKLPLDVHLMIEKPEDYIRPFADAGADNITVHVEAARDAGELIALIHQTGCSAGLVLKPATPASAVTRRLEQTDLILVMTVEPGFGGQSFMSDQLNKIREIKDGIERSKHNIHLEVDGGINQETAPAAIRAGANLLVAGTSVFRHPQGCEAAIRNLRGDGNTGSSAESVGRQ